MRRCSIPGRHRTLAPALLAVLLTASAAPATLQQRPTFGATVSRVRVDVIVTDRNGAFIDDLGPEDFVVYEDGEPQPILDVQLVDLPAGEVRRLASAPANETSARADPVAVDVGPPLQPPTSGATNVRASDLAAMVFLIDFPGLDGVNKNRFAETWRRLIDATETRPIPRAVYVIDQTGRVLELAPLTSDVAELRAAAETVRTLPLTRRGRQEQLVNALVSSFDAEASARAEAGRVEAGGEAAAPGAAPPRQSDADERARSRNTLKLLTHFCNALAPRPGRTALVWVTSELLTMEGGPSMALAAASWDRARAASGFGMSAARKSGNVPFAFMSADEQIVRLQEELHRAANSANVSIYTIDPAPAHEWRTPGIDSRVGTAEDWELLSSPHVTGSLAGLRDALRDASEETGGRSFIGWTDLDRALTEVADDGSRFYLITYATPAPLGDDEYHGIRVEVTRPGAMVRARRGYVDLAAEDRRSRLLEAALALPGTVTGFEVRAAAYHRWSEAGEPLLQLVTWVDLPESVKRRSAAVTGSAEAPLEYHAAALSPTGLLVDEIHQDVYPEAGARGQKGEETDRPFVHIHDWSLRPGSYELRLAVRERAGGRLGATRLEVEVREPEDAWQTSDLILTSARGNETPRPILGSEARADEVISAYVEVAGGLSPLISGLVTPAGEGVRPAVLPAVNLEADAVGIHRGGLRIRGLPPGSYVLHIMVTDPDVKMQRILEQELLVAPVGTPELEAAAARAGEPGAGSGLTGPGGAVVDRETSPKDPTDPAALPYILERLARVEELYAGQALSFIAKERVRDVQFDPPSWRRRFRPSRTARTFEFEYLYGTVDEEDAERAGDLLPGIYMDYRRRVGARGEELAPDEIVEEYRLAGLISRGFSFPVAFRRAFQPLHRYEIVAQEEVSGRPALVVSIEPSPPHRLGVNNWFGQAWIDAETYLPLKFELFEPGDYDEYSRMLAAERGETEEGEYTFTKVSALFETVKNGMRFPSEIAQERKTVSLRGSRSGRGRSEREVFLVTQTYSEYRFFNVRTEEEIHELIFGGTTRARIKKK